MFRQLREATRQALDDLPDVLRQMELQTVETRSWIAELEASAAGGGDAPTQELAEARDGAQQRLAQTVTAQLDAAREITQAVDRLLAGELVQMGRRS